MNLNALETFELLVETLSFTETAKRLNTVQPAISRQIKGLEQALGIPLFLRSRRGVSLTPEGRDLYLRISRPLKEIQSALVHQKNLEPSGDFLIGSIPEAGIHFLWPQLLILQRKHPKIQIRLHLGSSLEILQLIQTGHLHAGFLTSRPMAKGFLVSPPISENIVMIQAANSKHRDWKKRNSLDLVTYKTVDLVSTKFIKSHFPKLLRNKINVRGSVNSHQAIITAVLENDWMAIMPYTSMEIDTRMSELKIVLEDKVSSKLSLVTMDSFPQSPLGVLWQDLLNISLKKR